jgi:hypothetical protein
LTKKKEGKYLTHPNEDLITYDEAGNLLQITRQGVYHAVARKRLFPVRIAGFSGKFLKKSEVLAYRRGVTTVEREVPQVDPFMELVVKHLTWLEKTENNREEERMQYSKILASMNVTI